MSKHLSHTAFSDIDIRGYLVVTSGKFVTAGMIK